jgi:glutathionylspermidine synthase
MFEKGFKKEMADKFNHLRDELQNDYNEWKNRNEKFLLGNLMDRIEKESFIDELVERIKKKQL